MIMLVAWKYLNIKQPTLIARESIGRGVVICACGRTGGAAEDGILFGGMYSGGGSGCWERGSRVPGDEVQAGDIC